MELHTTRVFMRVSCSALLKSIAVMGMDVFTFAMTNTLRKYASLD